MIIVLDSYNILKQVFNPDQVNEAVRRSFINKLIKYAHAKNHYMVIVFDGGPHTFPHKTVGKKIEVIYVGTLQTADDYIKEYIEGHQGKDLLLVSSDRELVLFAQRYQVAVVPGDTFYGYLDGSAEKKQATEQKKPSNNQVIKMSDDDDQELDALMYGMPVVPEKIKKEYDGNRGYNERQSQQHTASKKERKLNQKLRKL